MANKCQDGDCFNTEGSYSCECKSGYAKSWRGQCEDVDECSQADMCLGGVCANTEGSFTCTSCKDGYRVSQDRQRCEDIDECQSGSVCANGICLNSEGSYSCITCPSGYSISLDGELCEDIDECALPTTCPKGTCTNTEGSFICTTCRPGYRVTEDGLECEDVDECLVANVCPGQLCRNSPGSFSCRSCGTGFTLSEDGSHCMDINECLSMGVCPMGVCNNTEGSYSCMTCDLGYTLAPNKLSCEDINECEDSGLCLGGQCTNSPGSYSCSCPPGLELVDGTSCRDVNECSKDGVCSHGQCLNTDGSYLCLCEAGFKYSADTADCEDQNECKEYGSSVCGIWLCENTIGSYRCFMGCQPGLYGQDNPDCDIDECVNENICGDHGFCENTDGSYRCQCDRGYTNPPGDAGAHGCVDVNECEMSTALCGEALCENVDGSFLCICPSDNEEFDPITSQCRPQAATDEDAPPHPPKPASPTEEQRKECYYNLNDANFCDNVLSRNTTKQECCCTVGSGWGDDCEIHPCPVPGREEYNQLCPHGSGLLPDAVSSHSLEQQSFKDVDECKMFGPDICKNGRCSNIFSSYSCFCRTGFYYDNIRLECLDYDECLTEKACVCGVCVNTPGSFNCFCSPPLALDTTCRHCISVNTTEVYPDEMVTRQIIDSSIDEPDEDIHLDICWRDMIELYVCIQPLIGWRTTYTECCCLYGVAWSEQCAFCPSRDSDDYALLCNLPRRRGSDKPSLRVPIHRPREFQPHPVDSNNDHYDGFEGLRAEECGILNGCENGRCVRVREGYTCDCFDGYELDLTKMACIDINECEDISDNVALCKNGACTNTEGSYKCTCLPGFQASAKPHECIPEVPLSGLRESGWKLRV
ncbi:unnamed protein product [Oncorhynchus mykiss]|uniref:Latent-transforming growth factor beta-binding protein 1 n=1 Tax=Oncorhynchus mykiss TaxID=8022 RepID=A0A060XYV6_ONCMY|nr:unnamed protein product [Oncorhynchus mykiss]